LALSTIGYLEKLVNRAPTAPAFRRRKDLGRGSIRLAIKDGLLSIRDNGKTP